VYQRDVYSADTYPSKRPATRVSKDKFRFGIRGEERLGSLTAAAGIVWAVHETTKGVGHLWLLKVLPPGPLEICAIGILIWLHAKWRRAIKVT
jgi:hypothetical protein